MVSMALRAARLENLCTLREFRWHRRRVRVAPFKPEGRASRSLRVDGLLTGAQRADVIGYGEYVDFVLPVQRIDDRRHRSGGHAMLRMPAVHQIGHEFNLRPRLLR